MSRICFFLARSAAVLTAAALTVSVTTPLSAQVARPEPLKVPDAAATSEAEMKPYTEPLEHTT
ncbi:MAG: hypothetical protein ACKON9_28415, partial [Planctomycetaceae bacterium]